MQEVERPRAIEAAKTATDSGGDGKRTASPSPNAAGVAATPPPMPAAPRFAASIAAADPKRLTHSWRRGCPVAVEDLRLVTLTYWDFGGRVKTGELVVHGDQAHDVVQVMGTLFDVRFPIERMELVDEYGGDDDRSMEANNTSAFNCRFVEGSRRWSEHAYGRAIDINPVQNPLVEGSGRISPPGGAAYTDRSHRRPGMVFGDDRVVGAFLAIGWEWGGNWSSSKDFQHFSETGR